MRDLARSAERILIPKGDDNRASVEAFQQLTDIEVPIFRDRELMIQADGREFWLFKGKDIPRLIARGKADIGVTGTDSIKEFELRKKKKKAERLLNPIQYEPISIDPMCNFSLLSMVENAKRFEDRLELGRTLSLLRTVTSRRRLLGNFVGGLPFTIMDKNPDDDPSGSVEAYMRLVGADLAADIVDTGETARQNGLVPIKELMTVYPEIVVRRNDENLS